MVRLWLLVVVVGLYSPMGWTHGLVGDEELVKQGKVLAESKGCQGCHGDNGIANINNYPNLAAQNFKYLLHELNSFAAGVRIDDRSGGMNQIAKDLTAEEIRALAAFYASRKHIHPKQRNPIN